MTAQSYFHSFDLTLSDPERNVFLETRLRLSRSFSEPMDRILAKVLSYCHSYSPDLQFSTGQDHNEPILFTKNLIGDFTAWIDIGCPSFKKLNKVVRSHTLPNITLYFFRGGNQSEFAREYRGWEADYASRLSIYQFDPSIVSALGDEDTRHLKWNVTFLEGGMYLDSNGQAFETLIPKLEPLQLLYKPE